jgi:hypothetical protein
MEKVRDGQGAIGPSRTGGCTQGARRLRSSDKTKRGESKLSPRIMMQEREVENYRLR